MSHPVGEIQRYPEHMTFPKQTCQEITVNQNHESTASKKLLRILIPINANEDSRWGVSYALKLHESGRAIEVYFLNVSEPITQWEVLRFRTQAEIARFQSERAQSFFDEASQTLIEKGIECRGFFKQGAIAFSILDTAEELDCGLIIMPRSEAGIFDLFSRGIVTTVLRRGGDAKVVLVDQAGQNTSERHDMIIAA